MDDLCTYTHRKWAGVLAIICVSVLAGVAAAKVDSRVRGLCLDVPCAHFITRIAAIESLIAQRSSEPIYLVLGDSITEFAELEPICGRKPLNAGIGSATTETFESQGARLAALSKPDFVVIELGTNDAMRGKTRFAEQMASLLESLKEISDCPCASYWRSRRPQCKRIQCSSQPFQKCSSHASIRQNDGGWCPFGSIGISGLEKEYRGYGRAAGVSPRTVLKPPHRD